MNRNSVGGFVLDRSKRAFELDFLRGFSIFMMILHHFAFDIRYLVGKDMFAIIESDLFDQVLQPTFLIIFVLISGICCQFSRDNFKRAMKLLIVAMAFSLVMAIFSIVSNESLFVFFNILHLLTVGTFLYALYDLWERKTAGSRLDPCGNEIMRSKKGEVTILILAGVILYSDQLFRGIGTHIGSYALLPLGFLPDRFVGMGDYLPIIPWLGFFFIGILVGRIGYADKRSLFLKTPSWIRRLCVPVEWIGRNSLLVYLLHQPIILSVLYLLGYIKL